VATVVLKAQLFDANDTVSQSINQ